MEQKNGLRILASAMDVKKKKNAARLKQRKDEDAQTPNKEFFVGFPRLYFLYFIGLVF